MTGVVVVFVACLISHPDKCRAVELEASSAHACVILGQHALAEWMRLNPGHHVSARIVCKPAGTPT
jgi:hypothetical protein